MKIIKPTINFLEKLIAVLRNISIKESSFSFTDLTPTDNADPSGTYSKAISYALENRRIKNIAINKILDEIRTNDIKKRLIKEQIITENDFLPSSPDKYERIILLLILFFILG